MCFSVSLKAIICIYADSPIDTTLLGHHYNPLNNAIGACTPHIALNRTKCTPP